MPRSRTDGSRSRFSDLFERLSNARPDGAGEGEDAGGAPVALLEARERDSEADVTGAIPWPLRILSAAAALLLLGGGCVLSAFLGWASEAIW